MRTPFLRQPTTRGFIILGLAVVFAGVARAQEAAVQSSDASAGVGQGYDWLKPVDDQQRATASGTTLDASESQELNDPFTVLSSGALWQEKYGAAYTQRLADPLSLSCETRSVMLGDDSQPLSCGQKVGFQFQPVEQLTLCGDLDDSTSDGSLPGDSSSATGAGISAASHLPLNAVLTLGLRSECTSADAPSGVGTQTDTYDAEWNQPIGPLPLTAVLKGHYEGTSDGGAPATSLPSLEQSFIWKPRQETTFQAGLRQQQYQEYPGVDHELNEALFADWSQKVVDNVTWHSYAEVLNSRGLLDQAPASPLASGANGTAQATTPGVNSGLTSSLPVSVEDQTVTFSTGPSFRLEKDISASLEYSDRWDKNPAPGAESQEQRISLSLKGTF
jgi:hypothetical protein